MARQVGPKHTGMCFTKLDIATSKLPVTHFTQDWNKVTCPVCLVNWVPDDREFESLEAYNAAIEQERKRILLLTKATPEVIEAGLRNLRMRNEVINLPLSPHEKNHGITLETRYKKKQ